MFRKEANLKAQKPATQNPNAESRVFQKHQIFFFSYRTSNNELGCDMYSLQKVCELKRTSIFVLFGL